MMSLGAVSFVVFEWDCLLIDIFHRLSNQPDSYLELEGERCMHTENFHHLTTPSPCLSKVTCSTHTSTWSTLRRYIPDQIHSSR